MPFNPDDTRANPRWLKQHLGPRIDVQHVGSGVWEIARTHLRSTVAGLADRFGHVHVYLYFDDRQKCDTRCVAARGVECVCSCGGENHGGADWLRDWRQVGATTLIGAHTLQRHMLVYSGDAPGL